MGRRGPVPEPVAAKLARGETRPSRVNRMEPIPPRSRPTMPTDMDAESQAVWRAVLRAQARDVILAADAEVLRCFCEAVSLYRQSVRMLASSSPLVKGRHELIKNPLHQIVRDNRDAVRLFARELGLSPAARASLQVAAGPGAFGDIDDEIGLSPRALRLVAGDA